MSELNRVLVGALQQCDTRDIVEDTFIRFEVSDYQQKTEYLQNAMGNPEIFFTPSNISFEDRYSVTLSAFLTGDWKLNKLYEKLGL